MFDAIAEPIRGKNRGQIFELVHRLVRSAESGDGGARRC
jgi:hypothetical protein